ncbi:hypothetical protein D3C71_2188490 [compost metagenome]
MLADLVSDIAENSRRNSKVKCADALLAFVQQLLQNIPTIVGFSIDRYVKQAITKLCDLCFIILASF